MFDRELVRSILLQIHDALEKIQRRSEKVENPAYFTDSPEGMEKLDGICMLFMAIGESLKNIDKITSGTLLEKYHHVDWSGVKGFRDIIAHHYFDIDADQVFWIIRHHLKSLIEIVSVMIHDLEQ